ncbi:MAG: hypothetical protein WD883_00670 [Candidatus Colwellbacteria bacterium]
MKNIANPTLLLLTILSLFLVAVPVAGAQIYNAGFITGVWLSKMPVFVGDTIRIYTAVQNYSGFDIDGSVQFVIDGEDVEAAGISAVNERIVEVWIDYAFDYGNHTIEAQLVGLSADGAEGISMQENHLKSEIFVDRDTDSDGVGDADDDDDDGDGISDQDELANGTDSLDPNDPGDNPSPSIRDEIDTAAGFIEESIAPVIGSIAERISPNGSIANQAISLIERERQNLFDIALERGTGMSPQERFKMFLLDIGVFLVNNWLWLVLGILVIYMLKKIASRRD